MPRSGYQAGSSRKEILLAIRTNFIETPQDMTYDILYQQNTF